MEPLQAIMEAGYIASRVRKRVEQHIEVGMRLIEICDNVETWIRELGGMPAFPCNVDVNHVSAHYTSPLGDENRVPEGSLVKVDIGVHMDGYIADTAITVCFEPGLEMLVEAAEAALDSGLRKIRAGVRASELGAAIERVMKNRAVAPNRNLTGHKLARYVIHAGKVIPNVSSMDGHILEEGEVFAVEPFTTLPDAVGEVGDGQLGHIFRFLKKRSVKGEASKRMLRFIRSEYRTLPFASRWVLRKFPGAEGVEAFNQLVRSRCLYGYPQLIERSKKPGAQAEHTVIVRDKGCEVTTA